MLFVGLARHHFAEHFLLWLTLPMVNLYIEATTAASSVCAARTSLLAVLSLKVALAFSSNSVAPFHRNSPRVFDLSSVFPITHRCLKNFLWMSSKHFCTSVLVYCMASSPQVTIKFVHQLHTLEQIINKYYT